MEVKEGLARINAGAIQEAKGPGTMGKGFYNPAQRINRDITIMFLRYARPKLALDGFGATGIRGIRFSLEAGIKTVISEKDRKTSDMARKNVEMNGADCEVINDTFQAVSSRIPFDFIDVDPYGTPLPYIDQAITSVRNNGYIALTATDLSSLTGSVASKTRLRYDAFIKKDVYMHEKGIRLLWGTVVRRAAQLESQVIPQLSLWHSHFYRIVFRIKRGVKIAEDSLKLIGYIDLGAIFPGRYEDIREGPVWLGNLYSRDFLEKMEIPEFSADRRKLSLYTENFRYEDLSLLFLDTREISSFSGRQPLSLVKAEAILREMGIKESGRTNFSSTGIKIGAPLGECLENVLKMGT